MSSSWLREAPERRITQTTTAMTTETIGDQFMTSGKVTSTTMSRPRTMLNMRLGGTAPAPVATMGAL